MDIKQPVFKKRSSRLTTNRGLAVRTDLRVGEETDCQKCANDPDYLNGHFRNCAFDCQIA